MSIEAMKQALEALDCIHSPMYVREIEKIGKAITALRTAIEQAEQPVAWRHEKFYEGSSGWFYADWHSEGLNPPSAQLLYTTPPAAPRQWVGLNFDELPDHEFGNRDFILGARWAEAKLKEKNA
jgi:hypothetical protein